jgi:hypothetical protein
LKRLEKTNKDLEEIKDDVEDVVTSDSSNDSEGELEI